MGSLRGEDGDGRDGNAREGNGHPPDDGGLPNLPPEWGVVVVPDDLTELDREAADLRRESRRKARRDRWRRRFGLSPKAPGDSPPVGIPLLIMSIAIVAALTSLFAITFTTHNPPSAQPSTTTAPAPAFTSQMIDLALTDAAGTAVRLRDKLPAVILLLDGCACGPLIQQTVSSAPASVTVLVVDKQAPFVPAGIRATALADPEQALLSIYADGPDRDATPAGVPTAVLVDSQGIVTATVSPAQEVSSFQLPLTKLS